MRLGDLGGSPRLERVIYAARLPASIVQRFVEVETAKRTRRAQFNEMVRFLRQNADCRLVIAKETDRLYRNLRDYVTLDEIPDLEIHLVKEGVVSRRSPSPTRS